MSIAIMTEVWKADGLSHTEKLVLICLADNANDDGVCWPSIELVAKKCSLNKSTVCEVIDRLCDIGYVSKKRRFSKSTIYTVSVLAKLRPGQTTLYGADEHHYTATPYLTINEPSKEPSQKRKTTRNEQLSDDWKPNAGHFAKCEELGLDCKELADGLDGFRNYHLARASKFADWDRAFSNWIGRAAKYRDEHLNRKGKAAERGTAYGDSLERAARVVLDSIRQADSQQQEDGHD